MKNVIRLAALLMVGISLSGCGALGLGGTQVSDAVAFTDTDLDNAETLAVANHDDIAAPCYPALKAFVHTLPGVGQQVTISGVASGFEAGRLVVNGVSAGIPNSLYIACGPLYAQTHGQLLKGLGSAALLH